MILRGSFNDTVASSYLPGRAPRAPAAWHAVPRHHGACRRLLTKLPGGPELVIDFTGVGRPIFDMFISSGISPIGVLIILHDNLLSGTIPLRQFLHAGIFDRSVGIPGKMKWEEQPIIVVYEARIDVVPHVGRLAAKLRAQVGNLHRIARLVLPLIGDLVSLGFPGP